MEKTKAALNKKTDKLGQEIQKQNNQIDRLLKERKENDKNWEEAEQAYHMRENGLRDKRTHKKS